MSNPEEEHIVFAPDDNIDTRALEIAERAFGIPAKSHVFMANCETLESLVMVGNIIGKVLRDDIKRNDQWKGREMMGHREILLAEIPEDDKYLYADEKWSRVDKTYAWYPPFNAREERYLRVRSRVGAVRRVEKAYGIKMRHFKSVDDYPELTIEQVAKFIDETLLNSFNSGI